MTETEKRILKFIASYPYSYPPTVREIGEGVGLSSSSSVHHCLRKLEQLGCIERRPNSPRCITLKTLPEANNEQNHSAC